MSDSFVDVFSGVGGLTLGLMRAGWRPLIAVDSWSDAVDTYAFNFPHHRVIHTDVREITADFLHAVGGETPKWMVGGPPCQGFSTVGRRVKEDPRNFLIVEFARLVDELRPEGILVENVLGLRDMRFVRFIVELFSEMGYRITPLVIRAADFGVPQLRHRVLFVGDRRQRFFLPPAPTHGASSYVTVWDAIGDLPSLEAGEAAYSYVAAPFTEYQRRMRSGSDALQGHVASRHPDHLIKAISFIPDGGSRRHIPVGLQPRSGFHNSYSRLNSRAPAVAVTQNMGKPSGTRCIHPFQNRGLTAREGARLQTFPDSFHFTGGMTSQRLQIANAVPPLVAERIGEALLSDRSWTESEEQFRRMAGPDAESQLILECA